MKKVYLSSLMLLASSAFAVTFEEITLDKFTLSPIPGTRMEYSIFRSMIVSEYRKDGVLLAILQVKTVEQTLQEWAREELKTYWTQKMGSLLSPGRRGGEGLIPVIEIPVKFPAPIAGIFGEGGRLDIGGSQAITFGGSKNYTVEAVADPNVTQTWFPDLKMEQHLRVHVKGTIGEKLSVDVDHDSKAQSDFANTIKLTYTGREDEIIQKVEAGDVSLSLPGTQYSSVSGKHKGLFGIKAFSQIGPFSVTAIASKEQGEASTEAYTGYGGRVESLLIDDYRYVKQKFYWLGEGEEIVTLEMFKEVRNLIEGESYIEATAWIDPSDTSLYSDLSYHAHFEQLVRGQDYVFNPPNWIELTYAVHEEQALAVYYQTESGKEVGSIDSIPLQLKLIKGDYRNPWHSVDDSTYIVHPVWNYELKNFYNLGADNIVDTSISVAIWRKISGASDTEIDDSTNTPYLQLLGLDLNGDGDVDERRIHNNKYLVFPSSQPFFYLPDSIPTRLPDPDSAIYYETHFGLINPKYYIVIQYQTSQPTISLPRINIIEESEVVRVGDAVWQRGTDYDIDYVGGTITLKRIPQVHEKISIDYQWAPLISLASKSLLGVRAAYELSNIGELGSTFLFRSVSTPTEKPKPGEEPTRNMLGEIDANLRFQPDFLTTLANWIPLVCTDKSSEFSISGEVAASFPNPNTKNQAYLDDMEGTTITHSFPINHKAWLYGSVPEGKDTTTFASKSIRWYNPRSEDCPRAGDIHEGLPPEERERRETVLQIEFDPDDTSSWAGISTVLSPMRIDLRSYNFLEVWVKGNEGVLKIDLAPKLSEDGFRRDALGRIVGYGILDTEDKEPRDGILDYDEDTGLDGVEGVDGAAVPGDDRNDDYHYNFGSGDYSRINGTEGNQKLDTEDLDGDNRLDTENSYFEYEIDLSDTLFQRKKTAADWKLYRIPLNLGESMGTGFPDSAGVKYGRIWITGTSQKDTIQIYSVEIAGNRWINQGVSKEDTLSSDVFDDEKFYVEVISNVYDTTYVSPFDPGVDRYGRQMRESSLELTYNNIRPGHKAYCYRTIIDPNAKDYTNYNKMAVWLKKEEGTPPLDFFIRFGSDTLNYYEVRKNISHSGWDEVRVELNELPLIKHSVYDTSSSRNIEYHVGDLGFKGNPSLTRIEWISIGIMNADSTIEELTGRFYVNELRLSSPKRNVGTAANAKLHVRIADLIDVSVRAERKDCEFRKLTQTSSTGSRSTTNNYSFSGAINLHKFGLNNFSIPLSVNMTKRTGLPKYGSGNDVELKPDQRWKERTQTNNLSYSLSLSKPTSSQNKLLKLTLDPLRVSLSRSHRLTDTPDSRDSTYSFSSSVSYSYSPKLTPINLRLFRLSYFPSSIRLSGNYSNSSSLSLTKTDTSFVVLKIQNPRTVNYSVDLNYSPVSSLRSSYGFSSRRDLRRIQLYKDINIGKEWQRNQSLSVNLDLPIPVFRPHASYSVTYGEGRYLEYAPAGVDSAEYLKVSASRKIGADLSFDIFEITDKVPLIGSKKGGLLAKLKSIITVPKFSCSRNLGSQSFGLQDRPSFRYQLGLEEIEAAEEEHDSRNQRTVSDVYSATAGLLLWKLNLRATGDLRRSDNIYPTVPSNNTWSTRTGWPQLNLDIDLMGLIGPFKTLLKSMSLASRYSVQKDESGTVDVLKSTATSHTLSPSLRFTVKKGINTTITYRYTEKKDQKYDLGKKKTEHKSDAVDLTLSYSFSAPTGIKLPLFSRIRFKSNLDLSFTGKWEQNLATQHSPGSAPLQTKNSTLFSVRPSLSYRFSQTVSGALKAWFSQRKDRKRDTTNRDIGMDFSATFRF